MPTVTACSNLQEYLARYESDRFNLRVPAFGRRSGQQQPDPDLAGAGDRSYQVQYKTNLTDSVWLTAPGSVWVTGGQGYYSAQRLNPRLLSRARYPIKLFYEPIIHSKRPDRTPSVPAKRNRAFTLVELLVVLAILGPADRHVVAGPGGDQNQLQKIQCLSNLHQLYAAVRCMRVTSIMVSDLVHAGRRLASGECAQSELYGRYVFARMATRNKQNPSVLYGRRWSGRFRFRVLGTMIKTWGIYMRRFYRRRESHVVSGLLQFERHNQYIKLGVVFLPDIISNGLSGNVRSSMNLIPHGQCRSQ